MNQNSIAPRRLVWAACALLLHLCTATTSTGQPLTIIAGPITNPANAHIYYLLAPTNWIGAWFDAQRAGGRLVTINDAAENAWVFDTFANYDGVPRNLWLGLKDTAQEGTWVWDSGDPSAYRNWAPGEPDNGGGGNEDYAVMRGPALSSPGTWNDVAGDVTNAPVVEKIPPVPPATGPFNVAADFSTNQNPNGVWSYGYSTTLGGPMTPHAQRGNLAGLDFWRTDISLGFPGVYFNPANQTATNATGTVVLGPRQLSFHPGPNGEFCLIRFTAPTNGQYQISGAFTGVDTNGTTTDVHILVNGVVINGVVNGFGPGSGPPFDLTASLQAGDRLDFAVGRGSNDFSFDSTGLSAIIIRTNPPTGVAPTITSQPQSWTVPVGADVSFFVSATGTAPLGYQWWHEGTNLPAATSTSLTLSNVQPANAGTYSVRVSNAVGAATSSNATLTVFTPGTNCAARPAGLVAWWRAEGNANDSAGTNHGTPVWPYPMAGYAAGEVRQAFDFNDYQAVSVPVSSDLLLTNSFAVEGWIFARQASNGVIFIMRDLDVLGGAIRLSMVPSPGNLAFEIRDASLPWDQWISLQAPVQSNQWHHIAATLDSSSGMMTLYVDGVARAQTNTVIRPLGSLSTNLYASIGAAVDCARWTCWLVFPFHGLIDELSLYSRALSSNEVHAIYSADGAGKCLDGLIPLILSHPTNQTVAAGSDATFTVTATGAAPLNYQWRHEGTNLSGATGASLTLTNVQPTDAGTYSVLVSNAFGVATSSNAMLTVFTPGTNCVARPAGLVAWWRAEGNANDSAGTNHGTSQFPSIPYAAGEVGQAFGFEWEPVIVPGSPDFLLTNSFAVEGWIYPQELSGVIFILGTRWPPEIGLGVEWPGNLVFGIQNANFQSVSLQAPIQTNQWHHIAATLEDTSGTMTLYVDGVARAQTSTVTRPFGPTGAGQLPGILIGSNNGWVRAPFHGLIDELSLYSRALTSNEVHAIYSADGAGKCLDGLTPLIVSHPTNQTVAVGDNAAFTVTATGAPLLNYQWRWNETTLAGATNASLTLSNVQAAQAGNYSVVVSNVVGVAISSNAVLTVFTPGTNCVARPAGLVAWWRAEGNANDSAGTNHGVPAVWTNTYAAGQVGQAFDFSGYEHVEVPFGPDSLLTSSLTVEGWIYARESSTEPNEGLIFDVGIVDIGGISLSVWPSLGNVALEIQEYGLGSVTLQAPIQLKQWQHIAGTFEGTTGTMTLYVDGVARAQTNTVISPLRGRNRGWLSVGSIRGLWGIFLSPYNGLIDELSLYSRAVSSNEVHAIYSAGSGGKCVVSPAALGVASLTCGPGSNTTLRIGGMAGNTYLIQASTNLLDWQVVGSSVADVNGLCEFEDPDSASFRCRYYRVVAPTSWVPATNSAQFFRLRRP